MAGSNSEQDLAASTEDLPNANLITQPDQTSTRESLDDFWRHLPGRTLRVVLTIDAIFVLLYLIGVAFFSKYPNAFFLLSLEREGNPPTWWYGSQQLLVALVFMVLASRIFESDERLRQLRPLFTVSAIGFGFISLDEVGELHEIGSRMLIKIKAIGHTEMAIQRALMHYKYRLHGGGLWLIVYTIIGVIVLIWLIPRVIEAFKIWPREVLLVASGFGIFVFSAAILQVLGYFTKYGTAAHVIYVAVEQALKMSGISIALYGVMLVLSAGVGTLTRRLSS